MSWFPKKIIPKKTIGLRVIIPRQTHVAATVRVEQRHRVRNHLDLSPQIRRHFLSPPMQIEASPARKIVTDTANSSKIWIRRVKRVTPSPYAGKDEHHTSVNQEGRPKKATEKAPGTKLGSDPVQSFNETLGPVIIRLFSISTKGPTVRTYRMSENFPCHDNNS
ncbi:hypothetical protein VTN77DRAFT_7222 [Rasamsonia byssochlamydoides]|uniref:uncharacterized protein n=1 Tax=Rasamsonia byssochlamydoides TaxID=89139 RepID=UPI0037439598